jgi:hypothetical protein
MEIFSEVGLCGVIRFGTDVATLTITDVETDKQITITSPMADAQLKGCHPIQNLGAVETYTRRYLWVTAMEIVEHDALDATTGKDKPVKIVHTPTQGAMDEVSAEDRQYLQELAIDVIAIVASGQNAEAVARLDSENLDNEQKTALWTLLDSKTRSAIKAAKQ